MATNREVAYILLMLPCDLAAGFHLEQHSYFLIFFLNIRAFLIDNIMICVCVCATHIWALGDLVPPIPDIIADGNFAFFKVTEYDGFLLAKLQLLQLRTLSPGVFPVL